MTKKLILLMLLIPLIVMISLFAATKTISIMVDVPVSGITVLNTDEHIYLNLDKAETLTLSYTVSPTNAKNKAVSASAETIKGKNLAKLDFEYPDGSVKITPKSVGSAKVFLTTDDGGYRASVNVHVTSEKEYTLKSMESYVEKTELDIGESVWIIHKFNPENPTNSNVIYSSDNKFVADVNEKGLIYTNNRTGTANITARSESNPDIFNVLTITVYNSNQNGGSEDGGGEAEDQIYSAPPTFSALESEGKLPAPIPDEIKVLNLAKFIVSAYAFDGTDISEKIELAIVKEEGDYYSITYKFKDEEFSGKYNIEVTYDDGTNDFKFFYENLEKTTKDKITLGITFDNGNEASAFVNTMPRIPFTVSPVGVECDYTLSTSNSGIISDLKVVGQQISYKPISVGVATITIKASLKADPTVTTEASVKVYSAPRQFNVTAPNATFGPGDIEGIFTLGKYEYVYKYDENGSVEVNKKASSDTTCTTTHTSANKFVFSASLGDTTTDNSFRDNIRWEVEEKYREYVYVDQSGTVCFRDNSDTFDEIVEFRAIFGKGSAEASAVYDIRCVAGGINVYSYLDLYRATALDVKNEISRSIVLRTNIIDDFGYYYINGSESKVPHYTEMHTTYDYDYYNNIGKESEAKVKVLVEFRNNVYGNGHVINAHNLTLGLLDSTGSPNGQTLFRGPLNFVAMSDNNSDSTVSFKAQDNICFGLYENAKLNNVNLYGATPDESQGLDLTDLNYAGTVVEILGDNAAIEYSRVRYGRTVIRAFGDAVDSEKKINFNIKNTRLSEAREFIVRIGSNRFVKGEFDPNGNANVYSPMLPGASGTTHDTKSIYNTALTDAERRAYDEKFINTTMTVESSIFKNTGLFAIGVDSHFSSNSLADGSRFVFSNELMKGLFSTGDKTSFLDSWKNLSKTSYGAKVKFVGEVKLDTWKPLADVNSDTLIETPNLDSIPNVGKFFDLVKNIRFDLQKMVRVYNDKIKKEGKTEVIHVENSTEYVHGGIVFFGGGKNYGVFDSKESALTLNAYEISLSEVDVAYLQYAAGDEPFYLFMFNKKAYTSVSEDDKIIFPKND